MKKKLMLSIDALDFLKGWLKEHILGEDKKSERSLLGFNEEYREDRPPGTLLHLVPNKVTGLWME